MIEQGSFLTEHQMHFDSDKNRFCAELKFKRLKKDRKKEKQIVKAIIDSENDEWLD